MRPLAQLFYAYQGVNYPCAQNPSRPRFLASLLLATAVLTILPAAGAAATFNVNNTANTVDAAPGDGVCADSNGRCTLRAAFMEAEALAGPDTINLQNTTYTLSTPHDIYAGIPILISQVTVNGNGATIRRDSTPGTPDFRIFYVSSGGGNLTLRRLTIMNGSGSGGGAILLGGIVTLDRCTLVNNRGITGGAILNNHGNLTILNSTLTANVSGDGYGGGGLRAFNGSTLIVSSTFSENRAETPGSPGFQGRGDAIAGGPITVRNSILASPATGMGDDCYAGLVSQGGNIASDASCALTGPGDLNNTDPLLGPLANNGGPTQTMALGIASPALDRVPITDCRDANGAALPTDQRGTTRPQGAACDSGAFEASNLTPVPTQLVWDPQPQPSGLGKGVTLRVRVQGYVPGATARVVFYDGGNILGYDTVGNNGLATINPILLSPGMHRIQAYFLGRAAGTPLAPSTSPVASVPVAPSSGVTFVTETPVTDTLVRTVMALDNLNANNRTDIVYGGGQPGFTVLTAGGNMSFTKQTPVSNIVWQTSLGWQEMTAPPNGLATGDFDRDGIKDVVITSANHLAVVRGNGGGLFPNGVPGSQSNTWYTYSFGTGETVTAPVVADFDRDGMSDIAVILRVAREIRIFYGNGALTRFSLSGSLAASGNDPWDLRIADLNNDLRPDLLWLARSDNSLYALRADSTGFHPRSQISAPAPVAASTADFNNDGNLDLAVLRQGGVVAVVPGDGSGGFGSPLLFNYSASGIYALTSGDFDGDGQFDILLAGHSRAQVWKGNGSGGFTLSWDLSMNAIAERIETADFSGDGRQDVVMNNIGAGAGLTFLRNTIPQTLAYVSGRPQSTPVGTAFPLPLTVEVRNAQGRTLQGIPIQFTPLPSSSGASASVPATLMSDANGRASATATANGVADNYTVRASTAWTGNTAFQLTNLPGAPHAITAVSGSGQSVDVNLNFPKNLVARVTDSFGNVVPGALVTFTAPPATSASAILTPTSAATNNKGLATVSPRANTVTGSYSVTAAAGAIGPATFTLTNTSGNNGTKSIASGNNQTTGTLTDFLPFRLSVRDAFNNPMAGKAVTFTVPAKAGSFPGNLTSVTVTTDATGFAQSPVLTAGTTVGSWQVSATATATGPALQFNINVLQSVGLTLTTSAPNPSLLGAAVTLTASVSPAAGPTGTVTFLDGMTPIAIRPLVSGSAQMTTFSLPAGLRSLRAQYSGGGTFAPATSAAVTHRVNTVSSSYFVPGPASPIATGPRPVSLISADLNGDQRPDLAVTSSQSNTVSVLLGQAGGGFSIAGTTPVGASPQAVVSGDFNADGFPDLAVANTLSNTVSILLGNGTGQFQPAAPIPTGTGPIAIASGDFNRDGRIDLAIANIDNDTLTIATGNGSGGFTGNTLLAGDGPQHLVVTDLDGDGRPDLAVVNYYGHTLTRYRGNGIGGFTAMGAALAVGTNPLGLVSADLNGDGAQDLAVANETSQNLMIFLNANNGSGQLNPGTTLAVGASPRFLITSDFNADGVPDLATANISSSNASLFLGNGSGGFTPMPAGPFPAAASSICLTTADFNGDSRSDLAVANYTAGNVSILLGTDLTLTASGGSGQSATVNTAFPQPLTVTVRDANNNPVSGVALTFSAPTTGASAALSSPPVTSAAGTTQINATANGTVGAYSVTAQVQGVASQASFALTNLIPTTPITINSVRTFTNAPFPATVTITGADCNPGTYTSPQTFQWPAGATCIVQFADMPGTPRTAYQPGPTARWTDGNNSNPRTIVVGSTAATFTANYHPVHELCLLPDPVGSGTFTFYTLTNTTGCWNLWESYSASPSYSITPNANAPAFFSNWSGDASGNAVPLVLVHDRPRTLTGSFRAAGSLSVVPGSSPQSTNVNSPFPQPLAVLVRDTNNQPLPGVTVLFQPLNTGASATLSSNTAVSGPNGIAQVNAVANSIPGTYQVPVTIPNTILSVTLQLTNNGSGQPASIIVAAGSPQATAPGSPFPQPLVARVLDASGNGVPNVPVFFNAPPFGPSAFFGGSFGQPFFAANTDGQGYAQAFVIANPQPGSYSITAATGSLPPAMFQLTNGSGGGGGGVPENIIVVSGTPQAASPGTAFSQPLRVRVQTNSGSPVAGVPVSFVAPSSGPSANLSSPSAITDPSGEAQVTATANGIPGSYEVQASYPGGLMPARFNLTNNPAPATIAIVPGSSPQTTVVNTGFASQLRALVRDANNNPVPGVTVTFAAAANTATAALSAASAVTDASGIAAVTAVANANTGSYAVTASVSGLMPAQFALTNTAATIAYTIRALGSIPAVGFAINATGQTTGQIALAGQQHAYFENGTTFADIHTLPGTFSAGLAINDAAQIAGEGYIDASGRFRAFRYSGGVMSDLGTLGGLSSSGRGINNIGHVTGSASTANAQTHAFLWNGATMIDLGTLGGADSTGNAINNNGRIVGSASLPGNAGTRAFFWNGTMQPVATPGTGNSVATAINDNDHIAGHYLDGSGQQRAFYWNGTTSLDLGSLGGGSQALGLNATGVIVGIARRAGDTSQTAFVYSNGVMKDLAGLVDPHSGWRFHRATGINAAGQITGEGILNGQARAFVLTPVP